MRYTYTKICKNCNTKYQSETATDLIRLCPKCKVIMGGGIVKKILKGAKEIKR